MRRMIASKLGPGAELSVAAPEYGRRIGLGSEVDFDEPVGDGTLEDALGPLAALFEPVDQPDVRVAQADQSID